MGNTNHIPKNIKLLSLVLIILACIGYGAGGVANPVKAQAAVRLFMCKFLGYDGGVNKAYKNILLSKDDPVYTRQCLLGCSISWFFGVTSFIEFETSRNPLAKIGGPIYRRLFFYAQQCVRVNVLGQQKCSLYYTLPVCVINSYRNYLVQRFIPWWPPIKGIVNMLFDAIPPLRNIRNAFRNNVQRVINIVMNGPVVRPIIKWVIQQMRTGFFNNLMKNVISAALVGLSRIAIPPPFPNPIPILVNILKVVFKMF